MNYGLAAVTHKPPPRALILAAILVGHAGVIYLMSLRTEGPEEMPKMEILTIPIHLMPLAANQGPPPPEGDAAPSAPRTRRLPQNVPEEVSPARTQQSVAITLPPPDTALQAGPEIDWAAQADRMNSDWADSGPPLKASGRVNEDDEPAGSSVRGIFERNSPRQAGYVEMLAPGVERRWSNSRCYRDFGVPADRIAGTRSDLNPLNCITGPSAVRDDLFDHLKPDYLQDRERAGPED